MKAHIIKHWYSAILIILLFAACGDNDVVTDYSIIPEPVYIVQKGRSFTLTTRTKLCFENLAQNSATAKYITNSLRKKHVRPAFIGKPNKNCITFTINDTTNTAIGDEGYLLQVRPEGIFVSANTEAGLSNGFRTFVQMLPNDIQSHPYRRIALPEVTILDYPRFSWRGSHLDCCRHFFSVKQIKKHLDLMASYKLNKFHWHLSDDQGWRIEIDQYPELNDIGSWHVDRTNQQWGFEEPARKDEAPTYGGYYSKADIQEIVRYAADRNIEVIPEIDLTSHCSAILAAYPDLSCDGGPYKVAVGPCWPNKALLCAGNEKVITFITNLLDEVTQLFPSEYIHIGVSESDKENWESCPLCQAKMKKYGLANEQELQAWLVSEIESILSLKGKRIIGWDDIIDNPNLSSEAIVMASKEDEHILKDVFRGNNVIVTTPEFCNLDCYQTDSTAHKTKAFPQFLPLQKVYQYDPMPHGITSDVQSKILGGEGILWSDYILNYKQAEYLLLPRLLALSECFWSQPANKDWTRFRRKIEINKKRLGSNGYNYCKGDFCPYVSIQSSDKNVQVTLSSEVDNSYIYYTTDGSTPTPESNIYQKPITLPKGTHLRTITLYEGEIQGGISDFYL